MHASSSYQAESTILTAAHSLRNSLNATFNSPAPSASGSSSHLLHPLGPYDPATRQEQLSHISSTISSIRSAVTAFSSLLPPPTDTSAGGAPRAVGGPTEKYLSLAKETATSETVLLSSLEADAQKARQLLSKRDNYAHAYPILTARQLSKLPEGSARGHRSLEILEGVASSLHLISFKDTHVMDGTSKEIHTLSLGGKVMVIDIEVESSGRVARVKVSYVLQAQHELEGTARRLEQMLLGLEKLGEGVDELSLERGLKGFRETLGELKRLDEMTEQTTLDCFAIYEVMLSSLQRAFQGESCSFELSSPSHGLLLPLDHSAIPTIFWHATPLARLTPEWTLFAESSFAAGEALDQVLALDGNTSCRVSLLKPSKSVVPVGSYDVPVSSTAPTFIAHFSRGVPITKATGRRIMTVLGQTDAQHAVFNGEVASTAGITWIEDLLSSPSEGPMAKFNLDDVYRVSFDDLSYSQDYSLADAGTLPGYLCTDVRFRHPSELLKVLEILKEQQVVNDLVKSAFCPANRVEASLSNKRRKLNQAVPTLGSLFAPSSSPSLPLFIHLSSTDKPSLSLSFRTPNTPAAEASPMCLLLTVDAASSEGLNVTLEGRGSDRVSSDKLAKVAARSLDLGLIVRSIAHQMG